VFWLLKWFILGVYYQYHLTIYWQYSLMVNSTIPFRKITIFISISNKWATNSARHLLRKITITIFREIKLERKYWIRKFIVCGQRIKQSEKLSRKLPFVAWFLSNLTIYACFCTVLSSSMGLPEVPLAFARAVSFSTTHVYKVKCMSQILWNLKCQGQQIRLNILRSTVGGTLKPKLWATLARSSVWTSKIVFKWWES
jgi:hypothetical protein